LHQGQGAASRRRPRGLRPSTLQPRQVCTTSGTRLIRPARSQIQGPCRSPANAPGDATRNRATAARKQHHQKTPGHTTSPQSRQPPIPARLRELKIDANDGRARDRPGSPRPQRTAERQQKCQGKADNPRQQEVPTALGQGGRERIILKGAGRGAQRRGARHRDRATEKRIRAAPHHGCGIKAPTGRHRPSQDKHNGPANSGTPPDRIYAQGEHGSRATRRQETA